MGFALQEAAALALSASGHRNFFAGTSWGLHRSHSTACGFLVGEKGCWTRRSGVAGTGRWASVTSAPGVPPCRQPRYRAGSQQIGGSLHLPVSVAPLPPAHPPWSSLCRPFIPVAGSWGNKKGGKSLLSPWKALGPRWGQEAPWEGLPRRERALSITLMSPNSSISETCLKRWPQNSPGFLRPF